MDRYRELAERRKEGVVRRTNNASWKLLSILKLVLSLLKSASPIRRAACVMSEWMPRAAAACSCSRWRQGEYC